MHGLFIVCDHLSAIQDKNVIREFQTSHMKFVQLAIASLYISLQKVVNC